MDLPVNGAGSSGDPSPPTNNSQSASPDHNNGDAAAAGSAPRPIKKRNRAQLSCTACHSRKQACNRQVPCDRCIKRGVAESCHIEGGKAAGAHTGSAAAPAPSTASKRSKDGKEALIDRIAILEAALREANKRNLSLNALPGDHDNEARAEPIDDVEAAAVALGELSQSNVAGEGGSGYRNWHGQSSIATVLGGASYVGGSAPSVLGERPSPEVFANLVSAIPPRPLANFLVDRFYSSEIQMLMRRFIITRRDTFERIFVQVLSYQDDISLLGFIPPMPTSVACIAMVSIVLATALQFLPDDSIPYVQQFVADHKKLQRDLKNQAKAALDVSEAEEPPSFFRVEATVYLALWTKNSGRPNSNYFLIAQAIRSAQQMGMHREGADHWGLLPYEAEQRRRLFWSLYAYDKGASFAFGRPYMILDHHIDVREPANADISLMAEDSTEPIVSKPIEEPTPYTILLLEIRISRLIAEIADNLFSCRKHTYSDVAHFDRKVLQLEASFPASFRTPSFEIVQRCPWVVSDYAYVSTQLVWIRCLVHRSYLLRKIPKEPEADYFAGSRQLAIALSQKLIGAARDVSVVITREQQRFFMIPFRLFDAAANLALSILQLPSSAPHVFANDRWILESRTALVNMGEDNVVAMEGVRCIAALRKKISDVLPEGVNLAAPVVDVGPGPHPIPYMGGTISFGDTPKDGANEAAGHQLPTPTRSDPSPPGHSPSAAFTVAPDFLSAPTNGISLTSDPLLAGPLPSLFDLPPISIGADVPPLATVSIAPGAFDSSLGGAAALEMAPREEWMNWESSVTSWPVGAAALQGGDNWDSIWQQIQEVQGDGQMGL
ncbi:fungal-specific transcription factor domain-domain-containing protein [Leucosporidium creatinivorum]|uniref:Fungal-specific transcription factor domain-domain-containing protein n=1 Tax=Leucosporidium creatinivorum TaxID=106004 RepID=A0A1Y2EVV2_9BASI|nr:fungal-specific transcription factor domain-domain-containing protein [Leucosporidium creatinivorum]